MKVKEERFKDLSEAKGKQIRSRIGTLSLIKVVECCYLTDKGKFAIIIDSIMQRRLHGF